MDRAEIEISPAELKSRLENGTSPLLVDVRWPQEHEICRLPNSKLLPLDQLAANLADELDPADEIVVYCHHGIRSLDAAMFMRANGFPRVKSLAGGIDLWSTTIDTSVPRY